MGTMSAAMAAVDGAQMARILEYAGIGIAITFGVLLVLIGMLYLFRLVFSGLDKFDEGRARKKNGGDAATSTDEKEIAAVITTAITAYRDDPETSIVITDIQKK